MQSNIPAVYDLSLPDIRYNSAEASFRKQLNEELKIDASFTGLFGSFGAACAAGAYFLHPILLVGTLSCGVISLLGAGCVGFDLIKYRLPNDFSNYHSLELLEKMNIRPSLAKVYENKKLEKPFYYLKLDERMKILPDLEQIRDEENEGFPVVTGGKIISSNGNSYIFENNGKESYFSLAQFRVTETSAGKTLDKIVSSPFNLSKRVTPATEGELKAYLDARLKYGDRMLIGGRIANGRLQADLFRDEAQKGAFDIYLKTV